MIRPVLFSLIALAATPAAAQSGPPAPKPVETFDLADIDEGDDPPDILSQIDFDCPESADGETIVVCGARTRSYATTSHNYNVGNWDAAEEQIVGQAGSHPGSECTAVGVGGCQPKPTINVVKAVGTIVSIAKKIAGEDD